MNEDYDFSRQSVINDLYDYYSFVYNPSKNRTIKKHPKNRELTVTIQQHVMNAGRKPEINAYSIYKESEDCILITEDLMNSLENVLANTGFNQNRRDWMFYVEFFLCAFHELGHLLLGHCEISKKMSLSAIEVNLDNLGIDTSLYQALEMDADFFAVRRLGEKVASMMKFNCIDVFGYHDHEMFYYDTLYGIRAFYYVLTLEEIKKAQRQRNISIQTGLPQKGCQPGEQTHIHPPSLARAYNSGLLFMEHIKKYFRIKGNKKRFNNIFFTADQVFDNYILSEETFCEMYQYVLDGTFVNTNKRLRKYYITVVRKRLKPYSRITMGLIF